VDVRWGGKRREIEVLQWARANGCPWDKRTCHAAAEVGHLEVLQWACANGCPCDEKQLHIAAGMGHEAVLRVLIEAGADVNKAIKGGRTPLSVSMAPVINVDQGQIAAIVKMLRGAGAV